MSRKSEIITHPNRLDMERAYIKGQSISKIARDFGVSEQALRHHCQNNLSRQLTKAYEIKANENGLDLLGEIEQLVSRTKRILDTAEKDKKYGLALGAIREVRSSYELLAKISWALHEARQSELALQRMQSGAPDPEIAEELHEALKVLTKAERDTLFLLNMKIVEQHDRIIIPDRPNTFDNDTPVLRRTRYGGVSEVHPDGDHPLNQRKTSKKQEPTQEPEPEPEEKKDTPMRVKSIPPTQIPSTRTDDPETKARVWRELRNIPPQRRDG